MMIVRNRKVLRVFSVFSLLVFLNQLAFPTVSYALTSGPNQPEFTSYEDAGSSDMVNLLTGDFTFNMPILTVPNGTDAGFTIPLSYHAGIGPDQEASWVGLGWNINVGSITRGINGFPDDASGESQIVNVQDLTGNRGWNANFLGTSMGWDSQVGHYGVLNLGAKVGYNDDGISSVGLAGLYTSGGNVSFSAAEFCVTVITVVVTILTYGAASGAMNAAAQSWLAGASQLGSQIAADAVMPDNVPMPGTNGYWKYNRDQDKKLFYTNYWIWLDQTRTEDMYGTLHLDKASRLSSPESDYTDFHLIDNLKVRANVNGVPQTVKQFPRSSDTVNKGAASDITIDLSEGNYEDNHSPALLAYDNYQVNGPGISGSIKPYRLETGTVSVPREMSSNHKRLNLVPYVDYGAQKVPFVYEGAVGNTYYHHNGGADGVSISGYNGVSASKVSVSLDEIYQYDLNDVTFSNERIRANVNETKKIPQERFVEWMTNGEIKNTTGAFLNKSFLDYASGDERLDFRSAYKFGVKKVIVGNAYNENTGVITVASTEDVAAGYSLTVRFLWLMEGPNGIKQYIAENVTGEVLSTTANTITLKDPPEPKGYTFLTAEISIDARKADNIIGGFSITAENGMTYHYAIPVYDYNFYTKTMDNADLNKNSSIKRQGHFANTWLLTAITGPDFVDRGGPANMGNGMVDTNDWGYWVKFNYGNYRSDFSWYTGYRVSSDNTHSTYANGATELYYLNSIETRTHVALFIKDVRQDNHDASVDRRTSLRLGEIELITRDTYNTLTDPNGPYKLKDCSGARNVVYRYSALAGEAVSGELKTYIDANVLRRIVFNTDYQLCPGTSNSDAGGKLTLQSISVLGPNTVRLFPNYKFTYGNNPSYNIFQWDGWGMYTRFGTENGYSHGASSFDDDGAAWSLTSIKSPLGNSLDVAYERDDYASVSGIEELPDAPQFPSSDNDLSDGQTTLPSQSYFNDGQRVNVLVTESYTCDELNCEGQDGIPYLCPTNFSRTAVAVDGTVRGNTVILDKPYIWSPGEATCSNGAAVTTSFAGVSIQAKTNNRKGGNLRVKTIALKDDFLGTTTKTRYIYTQDTQPWTKSSGVVSMEPDYIRTSNYDFYKWIGYPVTPVLYGKVTVLAGKLSNDSDYETKQVYEFITPQKNQYQSNLLTNVVRNQEKLTDWDRSTLIYTNILSRASMIGKIKSVQNYDKTGDLFSNQDFVYTIAPLNNGVMNYQGTSTEGTLLFDVFLSGAKIHHRGMRTQFMRYPYVLEKVITTVDGQTTIKENKDWDFNTGQVLISDEKSPLGITLRSIQEPAYRIYPELGSKVLNPANRNMLTQAAATYTYRLDNNSNVSGLVGASATTWRKDWSNYRKLDASGNYSNSPDLDEDGNGTVSPEEAARQVWRPYASYVWKGDYPRRNADGTQKFSEIDRFNFAPGVLIEGWQKVGSQERYNHNSALLESKDMNGMRSATKLGYNDQFILASAARSGYEEMAFSGAEDRLSATSPYFGGEVGAGSGTVVTTPVHTGRKALSIAGGNTGFVYRSSGVRSGSTLYRASVWCTSPQGRIYYRVNGGAMTTPNLKVSAPVTLPNGTWYRIDATFSLGAVNTPVLEVGVTTTTGNVWVYDDFRFQPQEAGMTAYVYNTDIQQVEYELSNDNLYTRYEYNAQGVLAKTYVETIQYGGEKLVSETKSDFRRFHIDQ